MVVVHVLKISGRGHSYRLLVCLSALLLACHCDLVNSQELVEDDISLIKNNSDFCIPDGVEILTTTPASAPGSIVVSWQPNSASPPAASEYQVLYRPLSSTVVQVKGVSLSVTQTTLSGLQNSLTYEIFVRLVCSNGGVGPLSDGRNVTLVAAKPANVTGVDANVTDNVVTVFWDPLPENQWGGVPLGYHITFDGPGSSDVVRRVNYPQTVYSEGLRDGRYTITVLAVNERSFSDGAPSSRIEVVVGSSPSNSGGHPDDVQVLEYPWTYILVPGLVCVAIIIVISLVICKKIREKKKRAVTYCRDIEEKMYAASINGGFNNIIPMNNLNSPVTSTSLSIPNSSPTASCSAHQPNPLATRPLPSSPLMSEVSPTFVEQEVPGPRFGNGMAMATNHQPPERKMPHPGGLPLLHEAAEPGFVQMHRTNTNQSVFSSSGASAPPTSGHVQRTMRGRAQTVGGIPSPYEVPEQNGNTLPRGAGEHHHRMAHHHQHGHGGGIFQVGMGVSIPPPPAHSPPPLTHSSMEIRARMADDVFSPPGQHTLPRTMGSSRSYSVTSPHGGTEVGRGSDVIRHMKSDGHLPILETHEEKMVYIQAPLDSSVEASIHSGSSYGGGAGGAVGGGVVVGSANERRPSPPHHPSNYHHTHHSHASGMGQPPHMMHHANNSATYIPGSESFSEMTSEPGSIQSGIPRMPIHHPPSFNRERSNRSAGGGGGGRESVFSETSTELSISSTSDKEMSPSWDHRGTTSEVGVGFRHPLDDPPMDREAYSDVGTPGQLPSHPHRVYKQV